MKKIIILFLLFVEMAAKAQNFNPKIEVSVNYSEEESVTFFLHSNNRLEEESAFVVHTSNHHYKMALPKGCENYKFSIPEKCTKVMWIKIDSQLQKFENGICQNEKLTIKF